MCRRPRLSGLRGTLLSRRARGGVITCNGKTVLVVKHCACVCCHCLYGFRIRASPRVVGRITFRRPRSSFWRLRGRFGGLDSAEFVKAFCSFVVWHQLRGGRVVGPVFVSSFRKWYVCECSKCWTSVQGEGLKNFDCAAHIVTLITPTLVSLTVCTFLTVHTRTRSRLGPSSPKVNDGVNPSYPPAIISDTVFDCSFRRRACSSA